MSEQNNSRNKDDQRKRTTPNDPNSPARRPRKKHRKSRPSLWSILGTLLLIGLTTGAILACIGAVYIKTVIMPLAQDFSTENFFVGENSVMYNMNDETGEYEELVTLLNTTSTIWVDYENLPQDLINATIAIEDRRFYSHPGVDWIRTGKAVLNMFTGQSIQGGSTLTQQVIKNMTEYDDVTVKRKITEIFRALDFDQNHSKEETITWYLNIIYLGEKCKGVGSAAYEYFGKDVSELSLAECASLIAITNNPSIYSPYGTLEVYDEEYEKVMTSRDYNKARQELILTVMATPEIGYITPEERDAAIAEELQFTRATGEKDESVIYSWYEEQVIADVRADLMSEYGYSWDAANMLLSSGGLSIYTCVDVKAQAIAESVYENRENLSGMSPSGEQEIQSAITVIDNQTGDVVALVGSMDDKNGNLLKNLATSAKQAPGSAIKPLAVYAPALEMGLITPYTVMEDYPHMVLNNKVWPNNVDYRFRGFTTIQEAVAHSYNTIAVSLLDEKVTTAASFDFVENRFHVDLVDALVVGDEIMSDMNLAPLALGGLTEGVTTREMAEAYATFPNGGIYKQSRTYSKVTDVNGKVILEIPPTQEAVLKESTNYYMHDMLSGVFDYGSGRSAQLANGMPAAGKTGTTNNKYDLWLTGYTPYYTAAVWVGYEYDEYISIKGMPASAMWKNVMNGLHADLPVIDFTTPNGLVSMKYCKDSGKVPTAFCEMDPRGSRVAVGKVFSSDLITEECPYHTAESTLTICVDDPIRSEEGYDLGWHIAGALCPDASLRTFSYLDYERTMLNDVVAEDENYLLRFTEAAGKCETHPEIDLDLNPPLIPLDPIVPERPNWDHLKPGELPDGW